mmetsp:Transcript_1879/g.2990  ORF Transcript_1879/g.2990 Transcript_1879/m.2990 type:complete len:506 (-) Transcript_1879:130-1647(-)
MEGQSTSNGTLSRKEQLALYRLKKQAAKEESSKSTVKNKVKTSARTITSKAAPDRTLLAEKAKAAGREKVQQGTRIAKVQTKIKNASEKKRANKTSSQPANNDDSKLLSKISESEVLAKSYGIAVARAYMQSLPSQPGCGDAIHKAAYWLTWAKLEQSFQEWERVEEIFSTGDTHVQNIADKKAMAAAYEKFNRDAEETMKDKLKAVTTSTTPLNSVIPPTDPVTEHDAPRSVFKIPLKSSEYSSERSTNNDCIIASSDIHVVCPTNKHCAANISQVEEYLALSESSAESNLEDECKRESSNSSNVFKDVHVAQVRRNFESNLAASLSEKVVAPRVKVLARVAELSSEGGHSVQVPMNIATRFVGSVPLPGLAMKVNCDEKSVADSENISTPSLDKLLDICDESTSVSEDGIECCNAEKTCAFQNPARVCFQDTVNDENSPLSNKSTFHSSSPEDTKSFSDVKSSKRHRVRFLQSPTQNNAQSSKRRKCTPHKGVFKSVKSVKEL